MLWSLEMELTLAQVDSETLPSPFALSDCKGLGLARCIDESVEIEGYLLNQWGNVSLAGAYGLGVTVHIIFTTKNPKTSGVKSINVDKKIFEQQIHSDLEIKANNGAIIKCHKCFLAGEIQFASFASQIWSQFFNADRSIYMF